MRCFALAALVVIALDGGIAGAADMDPVVNLAGQYRMQGKGIGSNDSAYDGTCSLSGEGPAYRVSCYNSETRHTYSGRGLASGDRLAIFIGDQLRGDHSRVFIGEYLVLYRRRTDGVLEGTWIEAEGPASGSEILTPIR
jgi:hypothetical protein